MQKKDDKMEDMRVIVIKKKRAQTVERGGC